MNKLLKGVLVLMLISISVNGYSQKSKKAKAKTKVDGREFYAGSDVIEDLLKEGRDTVFTRYFIGGFSVDSTRLWRERVTYTGEKIAENKYTISTSSTVKNKHSGAFSLDKEGYKVFENKKPKATYMLNKQFLLDGLVEEITHQNDTYAVKCIDKEGNTINEIGCLRYSYSKFPEEKFNELRSNLQNTIYKILNKQRGKIPAYIILSLEADYPSKMWFLALDFPEGYQLGSDIHTSLVAGIMHVLNNEKLEDYHFNKDINGNYYNRTVYIPIRFKR